jgi:carbonic anhydrase/acetyltransferase-like protein (isoleucine patch superfamily)
MEQPRLVTLGQATPAIEGAWVAPSAILIGAVTLGPEASVWYATVLRADHDRITIGPRTNVQDGCVMHADPGLPVTVGTGVTVGHRAVLHGCTVEDDSLIGMGAMVLNGAHIGAGSLVAAGSVVLEGTRIPPGSLVAGLPAKVRRPLTAEEREGLRGNAADYVELVARHREATG